MSKTIDNFISEFKPSWEKLYVNIKQGEAAHMSANERQVAGEHYRKHGHKIQHWDYAWQKNFDPFQYQITKYVERWKDKNGLVDLKKAQHFLEKYIELVEAEAQANIRDSSISGTKISDDKGVWTELQKAIDRHKDGMKQPFGYDSKQENATPTNSSNK